MHKKQLFHFLLAGLIYCSTFSIGNLEAKQADQQSPFQTLENVPATSQSPDRVARDIRQPSAQTIMINSRFAGWEGASNEKSGARITDSLRGNWVMVDFNGRFEGTVVPGTGADVTRLNVFLMHMGRLVKQTSLDSNGRFEFTNVRPGAYALIGWGDKGFFAFGLNILAGNAKIAAQATNKIQITAFQNETSINTDWIKHFASRVNFRVFGRYPTQEGPNDPASLYGYRGISENAPKSIPATSISSHPVSRTADGRLVGRVHQFNSISGRPVDVRTTKVMLLEGDNVVASTTTDNYGVFEFREVPDGSYAVTAAGVDGVGLIGITVAGDEDAKNEKADEGKYPIDFAMVSSETIGWLNHYAQDVAYKRVLLTPIPQTKPPAPYMGQGVCPTCNNCAGGCDACQQAYQLSYCRSRGLTFEQWQNHCQGVILPGSIQDKPFLLQATVEGLRRTSSRWGNAFDKAFNSNSGGTGGYPQQYNGYPQQYNGYPQQYNQVPMVQPEYVPTPAAMVPQQ